MPSKNVFLYLLVACWCYSEVKTSMTFTSVDCRTYNYTVLEKFACYIGHDRSYGGGYMILNQDIRENFYMDLIFDVMTRGQSRNFLNHRIDICQALDTSFKMKIFQVILKNIRRNARGNLRCPFKKNFNYTLTNFTMGDEEMPSFIPTGNVRLILNFFRDAVNTARFTLHVKLDKKKKAPK